MMSLNVALIPVGFSKIWCRLHSIRPPSRDMCAPVAATSSVFSCSYSRVSFSSHTNWRMYTVLPRNMEPKSSHS
ncbi:hypothetical protein DQ04_21181000 [Trypanosoma grayi]|uniref:hypothetical protein n=1 Tax=Trypanosoma grayi TaxID=71804 RepID=UPI0004F4ADEC|nr:hypothetical protein DQ04_21181000 [Trypanosoma grayi]KEG05506.1 hypothetical protein DQ04_21181000 [Trypanosoma grayi]